MVVIGARRSWVVATMNLLEAEHHYTPERVAAALRLRLPAKAAWLAARHWQR